MQSQLSVKQSHYFLVWNGFASFLVWNGFLVSNGFTLFFLWNGFTHYYYYLWLVLWHDSYSSDANWQITILTGALLIPSTSLFKTVILKRHNFVLMGEKLTLKGGSFWVKPNLFFQVKAWIEAHQALISIKRADSIRNPAFKNLKQNYYHMQFNGYILQKCLHSCNGLATINCWNPMVTIVKNRVSDERFTICTMNETICGPT